MNDIELARTVELTLAEDIELANTLVRHPRSTIEPPRQASARGGEALEELRRLGGPAGTKITLLETLGEGGMGVVRVGLQAALGRRVAVKTLRPGVSGVDATLRVLREAWVTGLLEHPNVVPIYDVNVDEHGSPVIVMKRVEGRSWQERMRTPDELARLMGVTDPREASIRVLLAVCRAVHFAHTRSIIHRDLKPENVMIGPFGEVYVLDWGIAVSLVDDPSGRLPSLSQSRGVAGTPSYMAPEMLLGDPSMLSTRTDVYQLGALFFEIFSGTPPHQGDNLQAMIANILLAEPVFAPDFPAEARLICEQAMHRDPARRHPSAEAFQEAVEQYLQHRGSRRLAREARASLDALIAALAQPPGEDRSLAIFNLLGECRFGYRAALAAWPGNETARRGLDRALLSVIEHELAEGDPGAAATLLHEVSAPPPEIVARTEAATSARAREDERLRQLEQDLDPAIGTRTRTLLGALFGTLWIVVPLIGWAATHAGSPPTYPALIAANAGFLMLGAVLRFWAYETMTKTRLNRRFGQTLGMHLGLEVALSVGCWISGIPASQSLILHVFGWSLTQSMLAVWVERWFAISAAACALSYLVISAYPSTLYPLMSLDNLILTVILVRVWLPRQDIDFVRERRHRLGQRARKLFLLRRPGEQPDSEHPARG
jgi:serine/threonine-protein kinase